MVSGVPKEVFSCVHRPLARVFPHTCGHKDASLFLHCGYSTDSSHFSNCTKDNVQKSTLSSDLVCVLSKLWRTILDCVRIITYLTYDLLAIHYRSKVLL